MGAETLADRHEVDVWLLRLGTPDVRDDGSLLALLSPQERERANRLRQAEHRAQYIRAHGLKRTILARYTGEPPAQLRFCAGPRGKPFLQAPAEAADARPPQFNLSHSSTLLALAVCRSLPVGIDVEAIRPAAAGLARRFFSAREAEALEALGDDEREAAFFRVWTAKEAYVKALGVGLAYGLERFAISVNPDQPLALAWVDGEPQAPRCWLLVPLPVPDTFAGTLAVPAPAETVSVQFPTL